MQEAEIPYTAEPSGQHMQQQEPQKLTPCEGTRLHGSAVLRVLEGNGTIIIRQNVFLWQNPTVEVATQIHESLVATAHMLAIHHPLCG